MRASRSKIILALVLAGPISPHSARSADFKCPDSPQQFADNVTVAGKASAQGILAKLVNPSVSADVTVAAQNLYQNAPNLERIVIGMGIFSMYCQIIFNSPDLTTEKRFEMISIANGELLKWASASPTPPTQSLPVPPKLVEKTVEGEVTLVPPSGNGTAKVLLPKGAQIATVRSFYQSNGGPTGSTWHEGDDPNGIIGWGWWTGSYTIENAADNVVVSRSFFNQIDGKTNWRRGIKLVVTAHVPDS